MRLLVVGIVLLTTIVTAGIAISLQYYFSRNFAIDSALYNYQVTAQHTSEFIEDIERRSTQVSQLLAKYPDLRTPDRAQGKIAALFSEAMRFNPIYYSIYLGFPNGDFYEVINLENSPQVREYLNALPADRWVVNKVFMRDGKRIRQMDYYDQNLAFRTSQQEPSNYDVRLRPWFKNAEVHTVNKTPPYMFRYPQVPGQTYSIKLSESGTVLGMDITLQALSNYLRQQPLSKGGEIYLYKASGEIVASNRLQGGQDALANVTPLPLSDTQRAYINSLGSLKISNELDWAPIDFSVAGKPQGYSVDLLKLAAAKLGLQIDFMNGLSWPEIIQRFDEGELDIVHPIADNPVNRAKGYMSDPIINLPLGMAFKAGTPKSGSLSDMQGKVVAIPKGWSSIQSIRSAYPAITILEVSSPRAALEAVRDGKAYATLDSSAVLHHIAHHYFIQGLEFTDAVDPGTADIQTTFCFLLRTRLAPLGPLLEMAIDSIDPLQKDYLHNKWLSAKDHSEETILAVPYQPLVQVANDPTQQDKALNIQVKGENYLAYVKRLDPEDQSSDYFAVVVPASGLLAASLQRVGTSILITGALLLLLIPAAWLFAEPVVSPIRRLFQENTKIKNRQFDAVSYRASPILEIDELNRSIIDMSSAIQRHEVQQRELMDAFIQLIATAIDEKSPYTGGHCARVPELSLMLAEQAAASQKPALQGFSFESEDQLREFRIAAWLHDCGKITVPEHIVDKGSKLETIYNRIHEIRMRFEVLWRDAELDYWEALHHHPEQAETLTKQLKTRQQTLQEDFTFVANTNVGGEFLSAEDQARLHTLSNITWQRHFDDRLGLSPVEELRVQQPAKPLPAEEPLLADKPEHLIPRFKPIDYTEKYGIHMDIPDYLYNLGELHNLSISRGTLTQEDRFKINEHMISTIRMLENLPFPPELANVPRYASTHHETLKGDGYPRKLSADHLKIPDRIIAIADVFEALTAADRPYKKAKTIKESLDIMHKMVLNNHLDYDIFELFLETRTYLRYAEKFLGSQQIEDVDISIYIRPTQVA